MISHISRLFSPTTESTDRRDAVVIRERGLGHERMELDVREKEMAMRRRH